MDFNEREINTPQNLARRRQEFEKFTDDQLLNEQCKWGAEFAAHVAATQILQARKEKREARRFHFVFWPALVAALAGVVQLLR